MKIHSVVLWVGQSKIEAIVEDKNGHRRKIELVWKARDNTDCPPLDWDRQIEGEVEFQISREFNEAQGRYLPRSVK